MTEPNMTSRALLLRWLDEYLEGTNPSAEEILTNIGQSSWLADRERQILLDFRVDRDEVARRQSNVHCKIEKAYDSGEISQGLHEHLSKLLHGQTQDWWS